MIPNYVVIPFRGEFEMTHAIVDEIYLQGDVEEVILMNNGADGDLPKWWAHETWSCRDWNLHTMYNFGMQEARKLEQTDLINIGIFNNDISIGKRFVRTLANGLRSDPTLAAVCGTFDYSDERTEVQTVGYLGHEAAAFMIKGELPFKFDESLEWWFGDTDYAAQARLAGYRLGHVPNAHFTHLDGGSKSVMEYAEQVDYYAATQRDTERFYAKWPMIPRGERILPQQYIDSLIWA